MALGVPGTRVGIWTAAAGHTGCTVVLPPEGSLGAIAVRGGAPGTREAAALGANGNVAQCHAIVLSGGSAFGLATADGASACTVGKIGGLEHAAKGGQGWAVASDAGVTVGALMAVNALGDVVDEQGRPLAASGAPADAPRFPAVALAVPPPILESTVIGCLVTDARLTKHEAVRAADLAHSGIARSVVPAHTTFDGDALFLLCAQRIDATVDLVAHLGALAVAAAIRAAVCAVAGLPAFPPLR